MPPTAQDDRGKITFYYHLMNQEQCLEEAQGDAGIGAQVRPYPEQKPSPLEGKMTAQRVFPLQVSLVSFSL